MNARKKAIEDMCRWVGIYVYIYSPGDGITRYRFSDSPDSNYCACRNIYTALGYKESSAYINGYRAGYWHGKA